MNIVDRTEIINDLKILIEERTNKLSRYECTTIDHPESDRWEGTFSYGDMIKEKGGRYLRIEDVINMIKLL